MSHSSQRGRRQLLKTLGTGMVGLSIGACPPQRSRTTDLQHISSLKGNIRHSASTWCYNNIPLAELARAGREMGLSGLDLVQPTDWKVVQDAGLEVSMGYGTTLGLTKGFNDPGNWEKLHADYRTNIPLAGKMGVKRLACFSGNRNGLDRETGLKNCEEGLKPLLELAEKNGVILCMETLNSKIDHPDYQCDRTEWGVELVGRLNSPGFRLLYDIYHMQIMEGDIIRTIRDHHESIAHYHTGGNPGRNEINETQELFYPAIMRAIVATGFEGFVAQEFIPTREDRLESLREAIRICDV